MNKIRVMIVDDHQIVREGFKQLLEINKDIEVVAQACAGIECLDLIGDASPDVIFMDIKMPGISGIDATRLIRENHPSIKIIMLTIYDDAALVTKAIRAGANGYVMKNATRDELTKAILHVMEHRAFLDPAITPAILDEIKGKRDNSQPKEKSGLTKRELEVLEAIVSGLSDKEIAHRLNISGHTVRSHIKSIFRKMHVSSKFQAATQAVEEGIIERAGP